MTERLNTDLENIDEILELTRSYALRYLNNLDSRSTSSNFHLEETNERIDEGIGAKNALHLFLNKFENSIVSSSGPRYWGFVTGGSTPASIVGDWLTSVYDQNPQATKGHGDISANIEIETINLLLDLLNLPGEFTGGFVSGATMSNFTSLSVARQWYGKELGYNIALEGISNKINILSSAPHSSILKSIAMLGMGSQNIIKIKAQDGREAMNMDDLLEKIEKLKGAPFILTTSAGTVNTADFDDFKAILKLKEKYNFWWHIDAAFGAFAALSSNHKELLSGWQFADSITIDCHKWLNVPYENAVFLIKNIHKKLQTESFQNSNAPYLGEIQNDHNYLNLLPENSRRLKALPVWFSLIAYGKNGYKSIVDNSIKMANIFGEYIKSSPYLTLLSEVKLNNVCFTLSSEINTSDSKEFLSNLNKRGRVFMTPTIYNSKHGIRASFVNWRTNGNDIQIAINEIEQTLIELNIK